MDQTHEIHWRAAKRILNFVKGTRTHRIFYKAKSDLDLIGCLLHLTHTRPDLYYAFSVALRYMDKPHEIHWRVDKRILNFVQGTRTHGIFYKEKSNLDFIGFTDSDWVGDNTDKKYTSGYVFMLIEGPINWSSKNKSAISLSSY